MAEKLRLLSGLTLLGVAGGVGLAEAVNAFQGGSFPLASLGDVLFMLSRNTLALVQGAVQGHLSAALWDTIIAPALRLPAALVIALPGLVLSAVGLRLGRAAHGKRKAGV